ncbi:hypothetical protein JAAARDRAFT_188144 [Jaapia argillacea MUCL 33604]|uniref:Zn(2)-C6 fungal-type domain-containing protein n=1 Tax=Jaapia argillacea MUCL 33604 TaxID=933084 RepID=A0A067QMU0_9AGAM|nr:hypothetical protein JAAARDRAFT_188144 [Jaapia argillacea MUCL 33604]
MADIPSPSDDNSSYIPNTRPKALIACDECRRSKAKCIHHSDLSACQRCIQKGKECHFSPPKRDGHSPTEPPSGSRAQGAQQPTTPQYEDIRATTVPSPLEQHPSGSHGWHHPSPTSSLPSQQPSNARGYFPHAPAAPPSRDGAFSQAQNPDYVGNTNTVAARYDFSFDPNTNLQQQVHDRGQGHQVPQIGSPRVRHPAQNQRYNAGGGQETVYSMAHPPHFSPSTPEGLPHATTRQIHLYQLSPVSQGHGRVGAVHTNDYSMAGAHSNTPGFPPAPQTGYAFPPGIAPSHHGEGRGAMYHTDAPAYNPLQSNYSGAAEGSQGGVANPSFQPRGDAAHPSSSYPTYREDYFTHPQSIQRQSSNSNDPSTSFGSRRGHNRSEGPAPR